MSALKFRSARRASAALAFCLATSLAAMSVACIMPIRPTEAKSYAPLQLIEAWAPPPQRLETSPHTTPQTVTRDGYGVTVVSVVQWPVAGTHGFTDVFGWRTSPIMGAGNDHKGVDLTPGDGAPVMAIARAVVISAGYDGALGNAVRLSSTINGVEVTTVYAHMQTGSLRVHAGQHIARGTVLGLVGTTGLSTGPHLHFEVYEAGQLVDPLDWITRHANDHFWD